MVARTVLLVSSIVITGLAAGLLFGWLVSVIPGLRASGDSSYINTMQSINVAIINPAFLLSFLGAPVLLAAAGVAEYRSGNQRRGLLLAGAAATYLVGALGATFGGNIPLNDSLDAFDLETATTDQITTMRSSYEGPWNRWHFVRTVASITAFVFATSATVVSEAE